MPCNFYCLSWVIWLVCFCHYTACKGNWHKKSPGCRYKFHSYIIIKRFPETGSYFSGYCFPGSVVVYESMVAGFCIPDNNPVVDFPCCGNRSEERRVGKECRWL